jgi:DNA-binding CsgD family transcriptional regulator
LVLLPGAFEHLQLAWQYPSLQPWLEGLRQRFQLIQLDVRGAGMSTRGLKEDHVGGHYLRDLEAVIDRLDPEPLVLFAATYRVKTAVQFALDHPERVHALVLGASILASDVPNPGQAAFFNSLPEQNWDLFLRSLASMYQANLDIPISVALLKQAFEQQDFLLHMKAAAGPTRESVSRLRMPVLVLQPRDYMAGSGSTIEVAQVAGARLEAVDGAFVLGDAEQGIRAIETFLASFPAAPAAVRPPRETNLSTRESEVLRLLAAGKSNAQIADQLVISQNTVIRHVSNIFAKIGAENRTEAANYAHRQGLA